jgi:hypothetical protein
MYRLGTIVQYSIPPGYFPPALVKGTTENYLAVKNIYTYGYCIYTVLYIYIHIRDRIKIKLEYFNKKTMVEKGVYIKIFLKVVIADLNALVAAHIKLPNVVTNLFWQ